MKLRALGTGGPFCRWPLIPTCWLIQTHDTSILVNCPPAAAARLEVLGVDPGSIGMIIPLGHTNAQAGGLDEFGHIFRDSRTQPYLACPEALLSRILGRIEYPHSFQLRATKQVGFVEEHITENLIFIDNLSGSYGFRLEAAGVFYAGTAAVNEEWLYQNYDCQIMIHEDRPELRDLPIYIQNKVWITGYNKVADGDEPLPMLHLPQSSWVYDSDRRDKIMAKTRYIRENSKRLIGNDAAK